MNTSFLRSATLLGGALLFPALLPAETFISSPVGYANASLLGESDSAISVPFIRPPVFLGNIQSSSGNAITVAGSPWSTNQFVYAGNAQPNHYYAVIGTSLVPNAKEGHTYPIVANDADTLTVDVGQDDLSGIPINAPVLIVPNWTLSTVFPAANQNVSFTPTVTPGAYKTQVRVPDTSAAGINTPYTTYYFSDNAWHLVGDATTDRGDDPLLPDSYFVVRNLNGAPTLPLVTLGTVFTKKFTVPLMTNTASQQDNPVSLLRPLPVALNATGLNNGSFGANDQLLVFDNAQVGYDKTPTIYYRDAAAQHGQWRLAGDSVTDRGNDIIPAGTGFVVRKAPTTGGVASFWTNSFPVQALKAVSRKTHGAAGDFDLDLPLSGTPAIECRGTGNDQRIVFTFPAPVTFSGAMVTSGTAATADPVATAPTEVTVNLTGVTDVQAVTVTLLGTSDGTNMNDVALRMGVLAGDTNGNGAVTASDIAQTKASAAEFQSLTAANFREDVTLNGAINASDIAFVKSKSGSSLPTP